MIKLEKYNDEIVNKILTILSTTFPNNKIVICGSLSIYLQTGICFDRKPHDIDIKIINFHRNNKFIENVFVGRDDIKLKYRDLLKENGIDATLDVIITNYPEPIATIKLYNFNGYIFFLTTLKYTIDAKLGYLTKNKSSLDKYQNKISKALSSINNLVNEKLNHLNQFNMNKDEDKKLIIENDPNINGRNDEYDNELYTIIKYVYSQFPDKDLVLCGSNALYLYGINLIDEYRKNIDFFIVDEHYDSDKNNPYSYKYKDIIKDNLNIKCELNFRVKNVYDSNNNVVNDAYNIVTINDLDIKVATFENIMKCYVERLAYTLTKFKKYESDISILQQYIKEHNN